MRPVAAGVKVGILVLALLGGTYAVWKSLGADPAGSDNITLWARFRDASGMPVGSKVVVAGLPVGEITSLEIDGRYAKVKFKIRRDVAVWSSAVVFKKAASLLGDHYLEIDPGSAEGAAETGELTPATRLGSGDQIVRVVEATSPDALLRRIDQSLPNVDAVLLSVKDLSEDMRRLVNGPIASVANRVDDLVQREAQTVKDILERADRTIARIDQIAVDIRAISGTADDRVKAILDNLDAAAAEARTLVATARTEVEATGDKVREKLDLVDQVIASTASITEKIDEDRGTLGRLVNDPTIADNVETITDDAKGFLGTLFRMQTYVGLRSEWNVFAGLARHYLSVELHTRPDKFYLIELEQGPRGGYPDTTLVYDPTVGNQWVRTSTIADEFRFTFQFAKRFDWLTLRYGIKESSGGVGADADLRWWGRGLRMSVDVFDASFDDYPRVKLAAAFELMRGVYVLGGIDEVLNAPDTLMVQTGGGDVPLQFEEYRFGRDVFVGGMIRFNDKDLAALLAIGGGALSGLGD
ncbi:MAG: MCE family protein [Kofleriaceae bacterium]|nr:MCE family protein [Kofleriaceae bacterium]MBP9169362.1 MCE family protein [Kofleriaceae bacterium]MBP9862173.1 MCE family protein [Kofleriaceae bacterium]